MAKKRKKTIHRIAKADSLQGIIGLYKNPNDSTGSTHHDDIQGGIKRRGSLKGLAGINGDIVHFDTSRDWKTFKS